MSKMSDWDGVGVDIIKIHCILYELGKEYILNKQ